jgi:hypothetical protein
MIICPVINRWQDVEKRGEIASGNSLDPFFLVFMDRQAASSESLTE